MRLEGMNALVTGATSGIGKAVAETLSQRARAWS
jgi:NAD(P)-dependent dehydrogenase (short-subunit alcohol dehydrogenase family)